ncbi:MAG: HsdM family class I SAM-dependent methyltransferase [Chloroflexota bacterium]
MPTGKGMARTFYAALGDVITRAGGSAVTEVRYGLESHLVFELDRNRWLLSIKVGQDRRTIKDAVIEDWRHKEQSHIPYGLILFLHSSPRRGPAGDDAALAAVNRDIPIVLIDAGYFKAELADVAFPDVMDFLRSVVLPRLRTGEESYYPLPRVVSFLREQASEMMRGMALEGSGILELITEGGLLPDLGPLEPSQLADVARYLASYTLMSQILVLRSFLSSGEDLLSARMRPAAYHSLRQAFRSVVDVDKWPVYARRLVDAVPPPLLKDAYDLICGLELERVHYELPGRLFYELMPDEVRKVLAPFYTRPQAADLLANLSIDGSGDTTFDPACGCGAILTSAYRRKLALFEIEGQAGSPHRRFCEEELFGADIVSFAVDLTCVNLAALDVSTSLERMQVIQGDSLDLVSGEVYEGRIRQLARSPDAPRVRATDARTCEVRLGEVDVVLMNPPFTTGEGGISQSVNTDRFKDRVGAHVDLWAHFIPLADSFLRDGGIFGALIPMSVLRDQASSPVRRILFEEWTPLYVVKPTLNYGFSAGGECRDVLLIARKTKASHRHWVKFALVKDDLAHLTPEEVRSIADRLRHEDHLRSDDLDIESYRLLSLRERFENVMWFCGVVDFRHRETLMSLLEGPLELLDPMSEVFAVTGYRPERGSAKFLFLTRQTDDARLAQAFLRFRDEGERSGGGEGKGTIVAQSELGGSYEIPASAVRPSLRTTVGLSTMDVTSRWDYLVDRHHEEHGRICRACGYSPGEGFDWEAFWSRVRRKADAKQGHLALARRINPFSPCTCHFAFYSDREIVPNEVLNAVRVRPERARAMCAVLNSALFLAQIFLLTEEGSAGYIPVRLDDLAEMELWPSEEVVRPLAAAFEEFGSVEFPPLRSQFDRGFDLRYEEFWEQQRGTGYRQRRFWTVADKPVEPAPVRVSFDMAVCDALGVHVSAADLTRVYEVFVEEMITMRGLGAG